MKVLVKAVAAGAIGCAGLLPAAAAHAHAISDPTLDSALAQAGIGTGALGLISGDNAGAATGNQVSSTVQTPVNTCGNAVAIGGGATSADDCAASATADQDAPDCFIAPTLRSHGVVEKTAAPSRSAKAANTGANKYAGGANGYGTGGSNGGSSSGGSNGYGSGGSNGGGTGGNNGGGCSGGANGGYGGGTGGSNGGGTGGGGTGGGGTGGGGTGGGGTGGGGTGGGGTGGSNGGGGTGGSGGTGGGGGVSGGVSGGSGGAAGGVVGGGVSGGGVSGGTAGGAGGTLALTGADSTSLTALGVTLIAGGSIALFVVRPRRRRTR